MHRLKYGIVAVLIGLIPTLSIADDSSGPSISGGITVTTQAAKDDRVKTETQVTADLEGVVPLGPGSINIHVEASSTPSSSDGVTVLVPETNDDVGSAVDKKNHGRIQVSELFYSLPYGNSNFDIGLMDASANLDTDAIANDETSQFLSGSLVNNPTIEFPDYTLGIRMDSEPESAGVGYHLLIGSSHGIADNDNYDYKDLFDLNAKNSDSRRKGVFAAAEGVWKTPALTSRLGIWTNTSDHLRASNNTLTDKANYGIYGGLNGALGAGTWSLRAGWADPSLSRNNWGLGAAMEYPVSVMAKVGLGLTHTIASADLAGADDTTLIELYMRIDLHEHLQVTPLIQYVNNPNFDGSGTVIDAQQWIAGMRLQVPF